MRVHMRVRVHVWVRVLMHRRSPNVMSPTLGNPVDIVAWLFLPLSLPNTHRHCASQSCIHPQATPSIKPVWEIAWQSIKWGLTLFSILQTLSVTLPGKIEYLLSREFPVGLITECLGFEFSPPVLSSWKQVKSEGLPLD